MVTIAWRLCCCVVQQSHGLTMMGHGLTTSSHRSSPPCCKQHTAGDLTQREPAGSTQAIQKCLPSLLSSIQIRGDSAMLSQLSSVQRSVGPCEFGLPLISGRDVSSQGDLIKKKEVDWSASFQREFGPALCNETAHTWALLQQLRHAVSLRRLQQSCSSCSLCVYSSSSPNNLLPSLQKLCFCCHRDGHDEGVLTPQAQVASRTLVFLSSTHTQLFFSSLLHQSRDRNTSNKILQTPPSIYKLQTAHKTSHGPAGHPETNCGFCWSKRKQYL